MSPALTWSSYILLVQNISHDPKSTCSFQGIFLTQGSKQHLYVSCTGRRILSHQHHPGSPWLRVHTKHDTLIKSSRSIIWWRNLVYLCAPHTRWALLSWAMSSTFIFTKHSLFPEHNTPSPMEDVNREFGMVSAIKDIIHFEKQYICILIKEHSFPDGSAVKNPATMQETQETWVQSLSRKHPLE